MHYSVCMQSVQDARLLATPRKGTHRRHSKQGLWLPTPPQCQPHSGHSQRLTVPAMAGHPAHLSRHLLLPQQPTPVGLELHDAQSHPKNTSVGTRTSSAKICLQPRLFRTSAEAPHQDATLLATKTATREASSMFKAREEVPRWQLVVASCFIDLTRKLHALACTWKGRPKDHVQRAKSLSKACLDWYSTCSTHTL